MKVLVQSLAIGGAGFAGALLRWVVSLTCGRVFGTAFPVGTLVINITGSLFLGWFLTWAGGRMIPDTLKLAIGVGFVGAYTTFSTYMYETATLAGEGSEIKAVVNLVGSIVLGLIAVRVGMLLAS